MTEEGDLLGKRGVIEIPVRPGLELRQRLPEDAAESFALVDANRAYLRQWLPWLDGCLSPADALRNIEWALRHAEEGLGLALAIRHHGKMIGMAGFNEINRANRLGQIGYWLAETSQGQGLMTDCVRRLVLHGFQALELNRLEIAAATENLPSRALALRLGFRLEGIASEAEWLYGRPVDHAIYALTKTQFLAEPRYLSALLLAQQV